MQYITLMSESFRQTIKREMQRQGINAYRLAKLVEDEIPQRTVYSYLASEKKGPETVAVLARALGLKLTPAKKTGRERKAR